MNITKKLKLAWQLKNLDKLSEADLMIYNSEWKKCSPEEQYDIKQAEFFLNIYLEHERGM
ncbi:hypothetical protein [endosymbiont GvMRE of Glomus versiforme]|uniref:hypothetical protein n=1 Tax=endosymbiont GvMRE of Glomus versiforme TaxID=2039283 RepID=UPI000EB9F748|nr:hypothetical protein [endosymbiont GvMRE of Glomus versiforme]RHZ35794.1 hypothetical protein GvMRE_Ic5g28 [endosymbiont GvMRE of Glomus versiforme]RHZ37453.1 hypothetical protein GvMRE_I1g372 [endosymbiont GvMRE of Glomus versiforme]